MRSEPMNNKIKDTTKKLIEQESHVQGSEINYQLKQARLKALDISMNKPMNTFQALKNIFFRAWFVPATAAAALVFYFMMPLLPIENSSQAVKTEAYVDATDMELIEQLELVENLEFYEWLSQEENLSSI